MRLGRNRNFTGEHLLMHRRSDGVHFYVAQLAKILCLRLHQPYQLHRLPSPSFVSPQEPVTAEAKPHRPLRMSACIREWGNMTG